MKPPLRSGRPTETRSPRDPADPPVALSVRQPWAALIVAGLKTVEVRRWPTRRRGPVLIHAGKVPDARDEAWARVATPELRELAVLRGGVIGLAEIADCRTYATAGAFAADAEAHLNAPDWFAPPRLFGLVLRDARAVSFYPYPGKTMFFGVPGFTLA
jgi:hypothetical protein